MNGYARNDLIEIICSDNDGVIGDTKQSPVICLLDSESDCSDSSSNDSSAWSSTPRWVGDFETGKFVNEVVIDDDDDDDDSQEESWFAR